MISRRGGAGAYNIDLCGHITILCTSSTTHQPHMFWSPFRDQLYMLIQTGSCAAVQANQSANMKRNASEIMQPDESGADCTALYTISSQPVETCRRRLDRG